MKSSAPTDFKLLGKPVPWPTNPDQAVLEPIPNQWPNSHCEVELHCDEFTCICPITSGPDFAKILIRYVPDQFLVESKALKLYMASYRNVGMFHEFVVNKICDDFVKAIRPKSVEVRGDFAVRGGIRIVATSHWPVER